MFRKTSECELVWVTNHDAIRDTESSYNKMAGYLTFTILGLSLLRTKKTNV